MSIATVDVASGTMSQVGESEWVPGEVAWLGDGSGFALSHLGTVTPEELGHPLSGDVYYLPGLGEAAVALPLSGHTLRWGASGS